MSETKMKLPARIENKDGSVTIKLKDPIELANQVYEEIIFPKPKAKHLRGKDLAKLKSDDILDIANSLAKGVHPKLIDELSWDDAFLVMEIISDFLPNSETIGESASL